MTHLDVKVIFDSDWSVGAGHGVPGGADQAVVRDADGLPFVPRTTMRGVLRDAVEQVATALDGGSRGAWSEFADGLFGRRLTGQLAADRPELTPQRSRVQLSDLRVSTALHSELVGPAYAARRQALVAERPAVAIDAQTGTAADRQLRFVEVARTGLILTGHLDLDADLDCDARDAAVALLDAGSRLITGIGSGRRRGLGRCRVQLIRPASLKVDPARRLRDEPPSLPAPTAARGTTVVAGADGRPRWLRVEILTRAPLVAAAGTLGNVVRSLDHLPGRALLPVVSEVLTAADIDVAAALRGGLVRISPALPTVSGRSPVPLPLCLVGEESGAGGPYVLVNAAHAAAPQLPGPVKGAGGGYLAPGSSGPTLRVRSSRTLSTHNVIDPASQRPDQLAGGVYSYEAIDAGTTLSATLLLDPGIVEQLDSALPDWRERLGGRRGLGASRMAGFGNSELKVDRAGAPPSAALGAGRAFTVLLTSPAACGRGPVAEAPTASALRGAVRDALVAAGADPGLTLDPAPGPYGGWLWARTIRLDGWNARDGLPRSSIVAAAAGTTLRLTANLDVDEQVVARAVRAGLGRRREEGLGWFLIDPPLLADPTMTVAEHRPGTGAGHGPARAAATSTDERVLLADLDRIAQAERAQSLALRVGRHRAWREQVLGWSANALVRSQLGNLRGVLADPDPDALDTWIAARREDLERLPPEAFAERWTGELLDRLQSVLADPANAINSPAVPAGTDATAVPGQPGAAHGFARDLLLVAAVAHARAEDEEVPA